MSNSDFEITRAELREEFEKHYAQKLEQQLAGRTHRIRERLKFEMVECRLYLEGRDEPNIQGALNRLADMQRILDNGI